MHILIIDGSPVNERTGPKVAASLQSSLAARGMNAETITLHEKKIGNCMGDFLCWIKTPGKCIMHDDNSSIAEKFITCDLVIMLTPVSFGGYASTFKHMIDHLIQNTSPFFITVEGELHHKPRYPSYPDTLTIGWLDKPDATAESIFRHLAWRNAINMYTKTHVSGIVYGSQDKNELYVSIDRLLARVLHRESDPQPNLPETAKTTTVDAPVRRVLLLVGSPRARKSTSASMGDYLLDQMRQHGVVETETIQLYPSFSTAERMSKLLAETDKADLVVLAFPLYVDSLPAPVMATLEAIAGHKGSSPHRTRFAALANCGFPEAHHNDNSLALCAEFARTSGFAWMGSISLGGGEGMVHGVPLKEIDGRATSIRRALDIAAQYMAEGKAIPENAQQLLAKPFVPVWLYRFFGIIGWKQQAKQYGMQKRLMEQPYLNS
jgi:multimeric flavodoxin WrbA